MFRVKESLAEATGATIYYHPGVFTPKKNVVLAVAGLAALTALAIGIITLLHSQGIMNAGSFNVIPNYGAYILLGGATVYAIALTAMAIQHKRGRDWMVSYIKINEDKEGISWWKGEFQSLKDNNESWNAYHCSFDNRKLYIIIMAEGNSRSIHLYANKEDQEAVESLLDPSDESSSNEDPVGF